jgi:hypothetical protein
VGVGARRDTIEHDLKGYYLIGLGDADGDQVPELFLAQTSGPAVATLGEISIRSLKTGSWTTLWSKSNAAFVRADIPAFPDNVASRAT